MKVKEESEKFGSNLNIQKTKIMVSGPIILWQIDGETVETVADFFGGAPKSWQMVTAPMKLKYTLELAIGSGRSKLKMASLSSLHYLFLL